MNQWLHETVRLLYLDWLITDYENRSFIITFNAVVSGSDEKTDLPNKREEGFHSKKIILSVCLFKEISIMNYKIIINHL